MKKLRNKITLLNILTSELLQVVTIISGFIIPKIILNNFGSEVNGLISSIHQFLGYMSLVEGGINGVVMASLYKPLRENDIDKIGSIVKTTQKFYNKISLVFILYSIGLAVVYPLMVHTNFTFSYVSSMVLVLGLSLLIQYNLSLTLRTFLLANKQGYVVYLTGALVTVLNMVIFYVVSVYYPNIHVLKLISSILFILQPIIYRKYVKPEYLSNKKAIIDNKLLKNRWDGFAVSLARFIHNNTDIIVLTIFTNLKVVSVYSIYALVTKGLSSLIRSVATSAAPTIGHSYASGNLEELNRKFDFYENLMLFITHYFYIIGFLLITPFVIIYTKNITDINYNQPLFGYLLIVSEMIVCLQEPYINLAYSANKYKELKGCSYSEAIINIVLSVTLVSQFGLIGVVIGTIVAMTYRLIYQVMYLKKNVLYRNFSVFFKKIFAYLVFSTVFIVLCQIYIPMNDITIVSWIMHGIIYAVILLALYIILDTVFYKATFIKQLIHYFIKKR